MENTLQLPPIVSLLAITFNFSTGEVGWSSATASATVDGTFDFMDGNDLQFMDGNSAAFMSG